MSLINVLIKHKIRNKLNTIVEKLNTDTNTYTQLELEEIIYNTRGEGFKAYCATFENTINNKKKFLLWCNLPLEQRIKIIHDAHQI